MIEIKYVIIIMQNFRLIKNGRFEDIDWKFRELLNYSTLYIEMKVYTYEIQLLLKNSIYWSKIFVDQFDFRNWNFTET